MVGDDRAQVHDLVVPGVHAGLPLLVAHVLEVHPACVHVYTARVSGDAKIVSRICAGAKQASSINP